MLPQQKRGNHHEEKLFACLLLLCFFASLAAAESISQETILDLSGYSDEEIMILGDQLTAEYVSRGMPKTADLMRGEYIGGRDIPAGSYILHCQTDDDHFGIVWVSAADDALDNQWPSKLYKFLSDKQEEDFYIELEEGGILNLPFSSQLTIYGGVLFK